MESLKHLHQNNIDIRHYIDYKIDMSKMNCPNCNAVMNDSFCPTCGQERIHENDLQLKHLAHTLFHELFHLDGRLWKTLYLLVRRPGLLTLDYLEGRRMRHISPFRLFLVFSALYYFFGIYSSGSIKNLVELSPEMGKYISVFADKQNTPLIDYVNRVDDVYRKQLKGLQVATVIITGLGLWLLFFKWNPWLAAHQIMAIHLKVFTFIVGLLMIPLWHLKLPIVLLGILELIIPFTYNVFAFRRVYRSKWTVILVKQQVLFMIDVIINLFVLSVFFLSFK